MSLYGLDFLKDSSGKLHLLEINGVRSGMKGFRSIYGDNRVENEVFSKLEKKYGKITVNYGSVGKYPCENFLNFGIPKVNDTGLIDKIFIGDYFKNLNILKLEWAFSQWLFEKKLLM